MRNLCRTALLLVMLLPAVLLAGCGGGSGLQDGYYTG